MQKEPILTNELQVVIRDTDIRDAVRVHTILG